MIFDTPTPTLSLSARSFTTTTTMDRTAKVYDEVVKCTVSSGTTSWEKVSLSMESGEGCLSRTGCSCTLIGNEMYIFAGQEPSSGTLFNDIFKVDLETKTLKRVSVNGGSPPPRHSHGCILLNDKCMVSESRKDRGTNLLSPLLPC